MTVYKLFRYPRKMMGRTFLQESTDLTTLRAKQADLQRMARQRCANYDYIIQEEEIPDAVIPDTRIPPEAGITATGERYSSLADLI